MFFVIIRKYEALIKRRDEYEQMQKKAQNKYDEIQSEMSEINKRRKLAMKQLDTQKEDIENLKKVCDQYSYLQITYRTIDKNPFCLVNSYHRKMKKKSSTQKFVVGR